ncbi:SCO4225 family membrane protein [Streptomyces sp. NPDC019531]|uniref:SCO4225 family membrane protein n=1 Tax=Streptomyces sp. NPDC019531 TaxID=3365062 RepID=UPI00384A8359
MSKASRPRRLLALATGNWLARGYLGVLAASVLSTFLFPDSLLAMAPMLLTAPLSFLAVPLPFGPGTQGGAAVEVLAVGLWAVWLLVCALVNAAALGALATGAARPATGSARFGAGFARRTPRSARPGPREPVPHRLRALLAPAVDNWLARAYLAVVAASLGVFLWAVYLSPDPGFAGIWPLMAAAPLSFFALLPSAPVQYSGLDWLSPLLFSAGVAVSGLVNAAVLGRLAHRLRPREPRPTA